MADLWGSERVSDPGVSGAVLMHVQTLYSYQQQDEIVYVEGMIEEIYERQMDQEEEYMQEQQEFYQNLSIQ